MGIKWLRVESWSKLLCISKVDVEAFDQRSRENSEEGRLELQSFSGAGHRFQRGKCDRVSALMELIDQAW